jgi:cell division protein FtsI (penicillin-binding protein 3)
MNQPPSSHADPPGGGPPAADGREASGTPRNALTDALELSRSRLMVTAAVVVFAFSAIAVKLGDATLLGHPAEPRGIAAATAELAAPTAARADIMDRNGNLLATSLATSSVYADPKLIIDPREAASRIAAALPDLNAKELLAKLSGDRRFVWVKRNLPPRQQAAVHRLGIPGIYFEREEKRFYPNANLTAHVVGYSGVDNAGLAGLEQHFDKRLRGDSGTPLQSSLDLRLQHVLKKELTATMEEFRAIGSAGIIFDVNTAEVLAMVSLPDFDPHEPDHSVGDARFNRNTLGVYEMGSTFKIFNSAMSLDSGRVRVTDSFDASHPIQYGRFTITDYHGLHRWLSVPEIFMHSSNIGSVRMALQTGVPTQKTFMAKMGFTRPPPLELPEVGWPLVPNPWRDINAMTISFGHGISVSPMHVVTAAASVINGGIMHPPTILKREPGTLIPGERVIAQQTSEMMRRLFRLVVSQGTAKAADVPGFVVGGKTGTADKAHGRHYAQNSRLSSFLGAFPMQNPKYIVYVMVDEPQASAKSHGYATGGWVAAPAVGRIVKQIAPLLGVQPVDDNSPEIRTAVDISPAGSTTVAAATNIRGNTLAPVPASGRTR